MGYAVKKILSKLERVKDYAVGSCEFEIAVRIRNLIRLIRDETKGTDQMSSTRETQNNLGVRSRHQQKVDELMVKAGQTLPEVPSPPSDEDRVLRAKMMFEEVLETIVKGLGISICAYNGVEKERFYLPMDMEAGTHWRYEFNIIKPFDMVETIDGCCDTKVVTTGTLSACGIPDELFQDEVDNNNLAKFGPGGYRREDGKWIKPPGHKPPQIEQILKSLTQCIETEIKMDETVREQVVEPETNQPDPSYFCPYCNAVTLQHKGARSRVYECGTKSSRGKATIRSKECKKRTQSPKPTSEDYHYPLDENGNIPFWPYCPKCHEPMDFDEEEPFATCKCGTGEWANPRPAPYVFNPFAIRFRQSVADMSGEILLFDRITGAPVPKGKYIVLHLDSPDQHVSYSSLMAARQYKKLIRHKDEYAGFANKIDQTVRAIEEELPPVKRSRDERTIV